MRRRTFPRGDWDWSRVQVNWESVQAKDLFAWWPLCDLRGGSSLEVIGHAANVGLTNFSFTQTSGWDSFLDSRPCLHFDGSNDFAGAGTNAPLQIITDVTLSCWFKLDTSPGSGLAMTLMSDLGSGEAESVNACYSLGILNTAGTLNPFVVHESGGGVDTTVTSTQTVSTGQWYHLAVARDTTAKVYRFTLNGVTEAEQSYTTNPTGGGSSNFNLGSSNGTGNFLDGSMSDARVYKAYVRQGVIEQMYFPQTRYQLWAGSKNCHRVGAFYFPKKSYTRRTSPVLGEPVFEYVW